MTLIEENDSLLDSLEQAEAEVEKIKVEGGDSADEESKRQVALDIKIALSGLVDNIKACGGDVEALGGALVLTDLVEALSRYNGVFEVPGLAEQLALLEKMIEDAKSG